MRFVARKPFLARGVGIKGDTLAVPGSAPATVLGVPFDLDNDRHERRAQCRMGGRIVGSTRITQTAEGAAAGQCSTAVAAAVPR